MGMDHYRIIKQLGGTSGAHLAVDKQDESKKVVIKRLLDGMKGMEELNVSLRVRHPNIIPFLESFVHEGALYVVLSYAEGGDLEAYLEELAQKKQKKPPSMMQMLLWFRQLISALKCCHDQNIIHRDVKPGNIFVNAAATELYLGDFGSAKTLLKSVSMTSTFVGSPIWISPELLTGMSYSYPSDIWSLGCVLYEMAALRRPFASTSFALLVQQITNGEVSPLPSYVPDDIRGIIMSMLQVDPAKRVSLEKAMGMTERAITTREGSTERPHSPQQQQQRALSRMIIEKTPPVPPRQRPSVVASSALPMNENSNSRDDNSNSISNNNHYNNNNGHGNDGGISNGGNDAQLSAWIHAREHDVGVIERYLNKFRQSDEEVLEAPTNPNTGIPSAIPAPVVVVLGGPRPSNVNLHTNASPRKRLEFASPGKRLERVSPQKGRLEAPPRLVGPPLPQAPAPAQRPRASAAPCDVRLEVPQQIQPQHQTQHIQHVQPPPQQVPAARRGNRRRIVGIARQPPPAQQRKSELSDSLNASAQRNASPLAREPSGTHHLNGLRLRSMPSAMRNLSPQMGSPQHEEERQQHREKREQERAKMMEMIRMQKAKALQERKAKGKSESNRNGVAIEIVLPDNVRYVDSV